jgi:DegV family protein with EDD domain
MQIVTDSGADVILSAEQMAKLEFHVVPLTVTLEGRSYQEQIDIQPEDFYPLLAQSDQLPTTSQPSVGTFVETYRRLAADDPHILSIHMSSGLSGTVNAARTAAQMVDQAQITVVDTKTLSAASGWQVEAAARAMRAGWEEERILALLQRISAASESLYTLRELKYLIHGGRISHMKGLIASVLNIKPLIGVEKEGGTYVQVGQARAFKRAIRGLVDRMRDQHAPGSALRVQVLHANNPEDAATLQEHIDREFDCHWLPTGPISLVLGAHTGPTMVGVAYAPLSVFDDVPS